jgi:uncharacterized protein YjgD (DUF1641 family)
MAAAVEFRNFRPTNSREDLIRRIEAAPQEHAQAVLEAYDLLENLHAKGILSALNGALEASETLINHIVGIVSSQEAVTATRLGLMLVNLLGSLDADQIGKVLTESKEEPPSLLAIAKLANTKDARRGMAAGLSLLSVFGAALASQGHAKQE